MLTVARLLGLLVAASSSSIDFECVDGTSTVATNAFRGAAASTSGLGVFAPSHADCVGTYNVNTSAFACVPISLTGEYKFDGVAESPSGGKAVFAPCAPLGELNTRL